MAEIMDVQTEPTKTAQTPAPATEPTGWMSPDGEFRDGAPEKIQGLLEAKKWTTVEQVVDSYLELEQFKGKGEHLIIPEVEDAEGWDNVYEKLGRPPTSDKYEFTYDGNVQISEELTGQFKQYAHKLGLSQKQFGEVVNFQLEAVAAQTQAYEAQIAAQKEENIKALKDKWGIDYDAKVRDARITADKLGIFQTLEAKGLASDPDIINMLSVIASRAAEDTITQQHPAPPQKTPQQELEEIKGSEAFRKKFDPKHKETMARFLELNQQIVNMRNR